MAKSNYQIDIGTEQRDRYTITFDAGGLYTYVEPIQGEGCGREVHEYEGAKARAEIASIIKEFDREYMAWCAKPNPDQEPHMAVNGKHDEVKAKSLLRSQVGLEIAS